MGEWKPYKSTAIMRPEERYIEMCWAHNTQTSQEEREIIMAEAYSYRRGVKDAGYRFNIFEPDNYFLKLGIGRLMCMGMLLDMQYNGILDRVE